MDPNAALVAFLDACRDKDKEAAWDAIEALYGWIVKAGGFLPDDPRVPQSTIDWIKAKVSRPLTLEEINRLRAVLGYPPLTE
jgi:hypothetical protein